MTTYQERKENTKVWVLIEGNTVLGAFGNLKKVCDFMDGKEFPSYWTLTRKKEDKIEAGNYDLHKVKLH